MHSSKALSPMKVTDDGIMISFNFSHFLKTRHPIVVTVDGIEIFSSERHPLNASSLIINSDDGSLNMIFVKDVHPSNALLPIFLVSE